MRVMAWRRSITLLYGNSFGTQQGRNTVISLIYKGIR
jgi:hypothetical protein